MAERNYSHRTLFDKLGVTKSTRVALVGKHDATFVSTLDEILLKSAVTHLRGRYGIIFLRVNRPQDLACVARVAKYLEPNGGLWIIHPKGRGASPSDGDVRTAGIAAGLVDNKISAYSETHTATRYVIPRCRR